MVRVERLAFLIQIADAHGGVDGHLAVVRRFVADEDAQQRRLARAVDADEDHAAALLNRERDVVEDRLVAVALAQARDGQRQPPLERLRVETRLEAQRVGRLRDRVGFDALELLLGGAHPFGDRFGMIGDLGVADVLVVVGMRAVVRIAVRGLLDGDAQRLNFLLLLRVVMRPLLALLHLGAVIGVVVAAVAFGGARMLVDLDNRGGDAVEELAVVRDDEDRAAIALQVILQPVHGGEVEVIGRLVEQQHVGRLQEQQRQPDARLLAAGERAELAVAGEVGDA